ncbi:PAS domain-containing sensor histidine kinase [Rhizobium glycinendophyticum]|nr:PAS domain-containing sensor histidine kinase [Rhizobium glycinendophyticum]
MKSSEEFLGVTCDVARYLNAVDWAATSLGPVDGWSLSLKATLRTVLSTRQAMCFWWGDDLLQFHNDAYLPMLGQRVERAIGAPFRELWSDVWKDVLPFVESALSGKGTWQENLPLIVTRNGYEEPTHWTFSYSPLYDDDGRIAGILNNVTETTQAVKDREALEEAYREAKNHLAERGRYEEELKLLNRELAHRMKNTLAMVQAIISQSLRGASSLTEASATISARIQTLAKAQDLLTGMSVTAAEITAIANAALAPHRDGTGRIHVEGPRVYLSAQQALGLSLAMHELATNATKYGSLSVPDGRVEISWSHRPGDDFTFDWRESQGPAVTEPTRRGFGSRLTERIVSDLFKGQAKIDFAVEGVAFSLVGKLHQAADLDH